MLNTRITVPASVKALLAKIGEQLKTAREAQNLSREDICQSLKMHINFVIALEEGLYEDVPGAALFFASLRSYARYLHLDANVIIEECKKNKFLFEALQGEGQIERGSKPNPAITQNLPKPTHHNATLPPATLPKLEGNVANTNWQAEPAKDETEIITSKKNKNNNPFAVKVLGIGLFLVTVLVLLFVYRYQLGLNTFIDSITEQTGGSIGGIMPSGATCKPFKLTAKESVEVKVKSLATGDALAERTLFPTEELSFSDAKGIEVEISDPAAADLTYNDKPLNWDKIKTGTDSYVFKCR